MTKPIKRVVMFSGGIGSWATAKIIAEKYGTKNLYLVFSDVKGKTENPHIGEDEDTYRFINEAVKNIGGKYIYLNQGKDIWEVFKEKKFLGNSRLAHCSFELKQKPARQWLNENCDPKKTVVYVGIDWTESHRLPAIVKNYLPFKAEAPLTDEPYYDKTQLLEWAEKEGLTIPRLYKLGFSHNNCGGGCVKAGQGQFRQLFEIMPERFEMWEQKEQEIRKELNKDVSILTEQVKGVKKPLPLSELKRRITLNEKIDDLDIGGCGCFFENDEREKSE